MNLHQPKNPAPSSSSQPIYLSKKSSDKALELKTHSLNVFLKRIIKSIKKPLLFYALLSMSLAGIHYCFRAKVSESILVGCTNAMCLFYGPLLMPNNRKKY
jgi:hypothetical protein